MSDLLLELFSEEIPAKMQKGAAEFAKKNLNQKLSALNISKINTEVFITPRRVAIIVRSLPKQIVQAGESIRGPRASSPDQAIAGFLKKNSLKDKKELSIKKVKDEKYYFYERPEKKISIAASLETLINELMVDISKYWPKSMRWGSYKIRWIRPLSNILCIYDQKVLNVSYGHLTANDKVRGHRFLGDGKDHKVKNIEGYLKLLEREKVILDQEKRKEIIKADIEKQAEKLGVNIIEDNNLLDEVTGLVEYPIVLSGEIDKEFMSLPNEVLVTSLKNHQKYFCAFDKSGNLAPYFFFVSNNDTKNNKVIIAGNNRVLSARLGDAKFFYEDDKNIKLSERFDDLEKIVFHKDIGDLKQKSINNSVLAKFISVWVKGSHLVDVEVAAKIAKVDLTTEMVGEFPELQGIMGYYYAGFEGLDEDVKLAIKEHYLPEGAKDKVPTMPTSVCVSLADKFTSLVSLIMVGEKPTGSKDPYAERRLAIGIIRIILENKLKLPLRIIIEKAISCYPQICKNAKKYYPDCKPKLYKEFISRGVLEFLIDRFKVVLKDNDISHDVINAVFDSGSEDDLLKIFQKSEYLSENIETKMGKQILESYRRANRIYEKAEKEDNVSYVKKPNSFILKHKSEKNLFSAYKKIKADLPAFLKKEDYDEAFKKISEFVSPIDDFFEHVVVNDNDNNLRENRLKLLASLCETVNSFANFSKIEKSN